MSAPLEVRRDQHFTRLADLTAQMSGAIGSALAAAADGRITAEQALAEIRQYHAQHAAATEAAWDEYAGVTR